MNQGAINKTMQRADLESAEAREIVGELNELVLQLGARALPISSWYGRFHLTGAPTSSEVLNRGYGYEPLAGAADDRHFPWFLYWEIVWVCLHSSFRKGQRLLDLGGSSSLFSYYLASKGLEVTTVDLQEDLVENANRVGAAMGWSLENVVMDMTKMSFTSPFDHITSICVYEHIPMFERVKINRSIAELLVPDGRFSITFDYRNPSRFAAINSPKDVSEQFVEASGLEPIGNQVFLDTGDRYLLHPFFHPRTQWNARWGEVRNGHFPAWEMLRTKSRNDYTFGALFQRKTERAAR